MNRIEIRGLVPQTPQDCEAATVFTGGRQLCKGFQPLYGLEAAGSGAIFPSTSSALFPSFLPLALEPLASDDLPAKALAPHRDGQLHRSATAPPPVTPHSPSDSRSRSLHHHRDSTPMPDDSEKDTKEDAELASAAEEPVVDEDEDPEEQEAEDEISEEQAEDALEEEEQRRTGLAGWLWKRRKKKDGAEPGKGDDVETQLRAEGENPWALPVAESRLLPIISGLVCPFSVLLDVRYLTSSPFLPSLFPFPCPSLFLLSILLRLLVPQPPDRSPLSQIPGLTTRWYVRTDNHIVVETQPNPVLLDIGLAISLALGVVANAALIWRFLENRPRLCTWISMLALTVHDTINIVSVVVFYVIHAVDDGFTNGSAFWLTLASTATSLVCNLTLALDLWRTSNFNAKGSGLTEKQRALVIVTVGSHFSTSRRPRATSR